MHKFIEEDLIQFLYNESCIEKTAQIKSALETDWELKEKYDLLVSVHERLHEISLSPSQNSIDNILSYAERSVGELSTST
ncbi:MAG: hypothetical protein IPJ81_14760 [Chitinophagaceae bacterium]|nr:hypothetical protein [Chitinophagaceae bacterium]